MYAKFFGLQQPPFSIAPDPRYLFMSERHRDALAHLLYGVRGDGGFVLLTGEIGAGKTTVCRCFLEQIPADCNVAYIFNPKLTVNELLRTICDEYRIETAGGDGNSGTVKQYLDPLNAFLLRSHAQGRNNVLIIDEAQQLSAEVLEQLRLLTNLETAQRKLLQIILIGQPELRAMLARPELEQLAQRVVARFHLQALSETEAALYVRHRLGVAGLSGPLPFDAAVLRRIHRLSRGVPRRINLLCDRALLGAYARDRAQVDRAVLEQAATEVFDEGDRKTGGWRSPRAWGTAAAALLASAAVLTLAWRVADVPPPSAVAATPALIAPAASATQVVQAAQAAASAVEMTVADNIDAAEPDQARAWRDLASTWKLELADTEPPCEALKRQQIECFKSQGGLALLRLLGRPSILSLQDAEGAPVYVTLLGLDEQHATVRAGGRLQTVSLPTLARQWRGEFATLWRAPPEYPDPAQAWLEEQLDKALGQPSGSTGGLKAKVEAFQRSQGLASDGRAGPITLMQLNRALGLAEPRLQPVHQAAEP